MDGESSQLRLLPSPSSQAPSDTELRLVTWNVQHAGPVRAQRQAAWVAGLEEADVLVLTEVQDSRGGRALVHALRSRGYTVIVPPEPLTDYMTVVAARTSNLEAARWMLPFLPHRCTVVRVAIGSGVVGVVGLYVPSRGPQARRNLDKAAFQKAVSQYLPRLALDFPDEVVVVAGDLNVLEPDHQPHYPLFGDWEYRFYRDFAQEGGLVDAYRELRPDGVEHSWIGRSGDGYRFDHIFLTRRHRNLLRTCRYLHEARLEGLSDHSAMAIVVGLQDREEPRDPPH